MIAASLTVQILSNGLYPVGYHRRGPMFDRLSVHPVSIQYLMPALIRFFIGKQMTMVQAYKEDVEMTGGHTQFWGKYMTSVRYSHAYTY